VVSANAACSGTWNRATPAAFVGTVPTNAAGVARFQVPLHAAFALTTLPAS